VLSVIVTVDFFYQPPGDYNPDKFWLSADDLLQEGTWLWSRTNAPLTYTHWRDGKPDNGGNDGDEHCLEMDRDHGYQWDDNNCEDMNHFICETP
jgi:hypothetical protein